MEDTQTPMYARSLVRVSPWILIGAVVLVLFTCHYGDAPMSYLLACIGIGIMWFALLVVAWRLRSEFLRVFSLVFVMFSQQILWPLLGNGQHFEIIQGWFIICAVISGFMFLSRAWLLKFARLEDHVA